MAKLTKKAKALGNNQFESDNSFEAFGQKKKIVGGDFHGYEAQQVEAASKTHLEDDKGTGGAAIVRCFEFGMNINAFKERQPTKQDLFNAHHKGIEVALWKDGLKVIPEVNPRVVFNEQEMKYQIFVGAQPMKGHLLKEVPKTLAEQIHGRHTE